MEAIFLACGAGGPQLKRNPLGGTVVTIEVWQSFNWKTLTVFWHARRADTILAPRSAIRQAVADLEARGASVTVAPTEDALKFRYRWLTGRTWLSYAWNGRLQVRAADGRTTAVASASVAPGILFPVAVFLGFYITLRWLAFVMSPFLSIMIPVIYLVCSDGVATTATAALTPKEGHSAA